LGVLQLVPEGADVHHPGWQQVVEGPGHLVINAEEVQLALATLKSLGVEMLHSASEGRIHHGQDNLDDLPGEKSLSPVLTLRAG
jgi:hypothetical protein